MSLITTSNSFSILTNEFLSKYNDFPDEMNSLGRFVFLRTYSRYIHNQKRRETYKEVCIRVSNYSISLLKNHIDKIGLKLSDDDKKKMYNEECEKLFDNIYHLRQFVSGRTLWVGGLEIAYKYPMSNFNCSFTNITSYNDFSEIFYLLLLGTGVGIKCTKQMASSLPKIRLDIKVEHSEYKPLPKKYRLEHTEIRLLPNGYCKILIGDSKEGWVEALKYYFMNLTDLSSNIHTIKFSYNSIRQKGDRLMRFGGTASGYLPLKNMFIGIDNMLKSKDSTYIDEIKDNQLRPIHILDICNMIGQNVVVGGVRRCLPKGSLIHTKNGMIPIENVKVYDYVLTLDGYERVSDFFIQGERDVYKIKSSCGDFYATDNHRMPVLFNNEYLVWTETSKLKKGDKLVIVNKPICGEDIYINYHNDNYDLLSNKYSYILGYTCIKMNENRKYNDNLGELDKLFIEVFGDRKYIDKYRDYFISLDLLNIPYFIMNSKLDKRLMFIYGFIVGMSKITTSSTHFKIYNDNSKLLRRFQMLMYSCGIYTVRKDDYIEIDISFMENIENKHYTYSDDRKRTAEVESVEFDRKDECYDITVSNQHNFFCEGYLTHNTSEIFLFDYDDYEVLFSKYGINGFWTEEQKMNHINLSKKLEEMKIKPRWFDSLCENGVWKQRENIEHRRMSNNSIIFSNKPTFEFLDLVFNILRNEGEPGFFNLESASKRRPNAEGPNPCGEIILDSKGLCNLTTINLVQFVKNGKMDIEKLLDTQRISVRCGLRMTLPTLELEEWNKIQQRDRLLGCSLTGIKDALGMCDNIDEEKLLSLMRETVEDEATKYSKKIRVNCPLLSTTIKPEGTISQLCGGVSCGIHPCHSQYYIRRVRINASDPLAKSCLEMGWDIHPEVGTKGNTEEEKLRNATTLVIDFPVKSGAIETKDNTSAEKQLETYFRYQKYYTQHNTSNTITVRSNEWNIVRDIIYKNWDDFVGVSFCSLDGGTYQLMPYESCDEEKYLSLKNKMKPFDMNVLIKYEKELDKEDDNMVSECKGGVCPIR